MTDAKPQYTCIHEDEFQTHSRKIEALEVKSTYKEARIDELNEKIEKMDKKIDKLNENVNQLILKSNENDKDIEIRVKAIETELSIQKQTYNNRLAIIGIALTIITICINVFFNVIK